MSKNDKRMPIEQARAVAEKLGSALSESGVRYEICGSLRRGTKPDVGDLDVVVSDLQKAAWVCERQLGGNVIMPKQKKNKPIRQGYADLPEGIRAGLYFAYPEEWGAMVLFLTGNHIFNIKMRANAKRQGLKLNQYGLWENENAIAGRDEQQIFMALGMEYVEPKDREDSPWQRVPGPYNFKAKREAANEGSSETERA